MRRPHAALAILAAGASTRSGSDKVLADLGGRPVLEWSLMAGRAAGVFAETIVVTAAERVPALRALVRTIDPAARVISGGATRTSSAWCAVDATPDAQILAIHDAARPFAPPSLFARLVQAAERDGSAVPGLAVMDTVRRTDEAGTALEELDRAGLWIAQTPQVFGRELLIRARGRVGDRTFPDDAAALTAAGIPVKMVAGERRNLKLTTIEDLAYARELVACGAVGMPAVQVG
ncbi:MAG: 2-C-methyl-D-erythritol 4-phosphate cytidylyltransferase [Chloroflexota bacterium]|nr:2-C-methyl-D-erythritol 4-phosphate cytidylyltransferase [Chloroflexota bacterium]